MGKNINRLLFIEGGKDKELFGKIIWADNAIDEEFACYAITDGEGNVRHYLQNELVNDNKIQPSDWYYVFYNTEKEPVAYFDDNGGTDYGPWTI